MGYQLIINKLNKHYIYNRILGCEGGRYCAVEQLNLKEGLKILCTVNVLSLYIYIVSVNFKALLVSRMCKYTLSFLTLFVGVVKMS